MSDPVDRVTKPFREFGSSVKKLADDIGEGIGELGKDIEQGVKDVKTVFRPPAPPKVEAAPAPGGTDQPTERDAAIALAVDQQRKRLRAARGRSSTILTAGNTLGEPPTRRKTILGG